MLFVLWLSLNCMPDNVLSGYPSEAAVIKLIVVDTKIIDYRINGLFYQWTQHGEAS